MNKTAQPTLEEQLGKELHGFIIRLSKPPEMDGHEPLDLKLYVKNHELELKPIAQNVLVKTRYPLPPDQVRCLARYTQHLRGATVIRSRNLPVKMDAVLSPWVRLKEETEDD